MATLNLLRNVFSLSRSLRVEQGRHEAQLRVQGNRLHSTLIIRCSEILRVRVSLLINDRITRNAPPIDVTKMVEKFSQFQGSSMRLVKHVVKTRTQVNLRLGLIWPWCESANLISEFQVCRVVDDCQ